jgi:hypothetical protein
MYHFLIKQKKNIKMNSQMECWLCRCTETDSHTGCMIKDVCKCTGSMNYIHQRCIVDYTLSKKKDRFVCSICSHSYDSGKIRDAYKKTGIELVTEDSEYRAQITSICVIWILYSIYTLVRVLFKLDITYGDDYYYRAFVYIVSNLFYLGIMQSLYKENKLIAVCFFSGQLCYYLFISN